MELESAYLLILWRLLPGSSIEHLHGEPAPWHVFCQVLINSLTNGFLVQLFYVHQLHGTVIRFLHFVCKQFMRYFQCLDITQLHCIVGYYTIYQSICLFKKWQPDEIEQTFTGHPLFLRSCVILSTDHIIPWGIASFSDSQTRHLNLPSQPAGSTQIPLSLTSKQLFKSLPFLFHSSFLPQLLIPLDF